MAQTRAYVPVRFGMPGYRRVTGNLGGWEHLVTEWFASRGRWSRLAIAFGAGLLMTGGHAPVSLPWLLFLAVPVLVWQTATAPTPKIAAWIGWAAGFGYFLSGLHWIGHAFLVDADRWAWLMPFGVTALPAGLAIFWAAAFWLARRLGADRPAAMVLPLAAAITLAEFARSYLLTGLPWGLPGYVWVDLPPMQAASWAGPFGMTLFTLILTATPAVAMAARNWLATGTALVACLAFWVFGELRLPDQIAYAPDAPVLRIVQPNAPQHLKWVPGHREIFYKRALDATMAESDPELGPPDAVIWPEMAVFFVPADKPREVERIAQAANGAQVLLGAFHVVAEPGGERWSNAMVTVQPDGTLGPHYDKHHLVPFGEYVPLRSVLGLLGITQMAKRGGFSRGAGPQTLKLPGLPPVSPLICYEAIFPYEVVGDTRPEWMVQITNDAWFGTFAGPRQHYAQARIRAIEQGLPIVRAANTGISAVVDPHGLEVVSISQHNYGKVDARLPAPLPATLYSRAGDKPTFIVIVFLLLLAIVHRNIRIRD